jgi:CelD/BcsL family acetyltransferase involved in cellulose biosynthesis
MHYDLVYGNSYFHYNSGRDPRYDSLSPGLLVRAATIRAAIDEGLVSYRFLRGDETYKYRFPVHDDQVATVIKANNLRGAAAIAGVRLAIKSAPMRRVIRRVVGPVSRTAAAIPSSQSIVPEE